ncbi:MAG: hypothetical protein IPF94_14260 [Betaproteobacteria bacterium]|nr:hypothetical protein [Betaproteobacteria bacterium]
MTLLNKPLARGCVLALVLSSAGAAIAQDKTVYRCPGPPVLYTDSMSPQEAKDKGCRAVEGVPVTVVPAPPRPRAAAPGTGASARPGEGRVDPAEQRARDSDAKRILSDELRREEDRLSDMKREFNNGEPERRGDERNFAKYQDRVAEMRAAIQRKEADVAALKRELAKLPS